MLSFVCGGLSIGFDYSESNLFTVDKINTIDESEFEWHCSCMNVWILFPLCVNTIQSKMEFLVTENVANLFLLLFLVNKAFSYKRDH